MHVWDRKGLLQESRLVFVLHMGSELDLSLNPCKLAGFIKGDWMGAIQYVVPGLEETGWEEKVVSEEQKSRSRKGRDQATKASELAKIHPTDSQRASHSLIGWK